MANDKLQNSKSAKWSDANATTGQKLNAASYIGIVKNNVDPTRSGRLQVWIPDFGASQNNTTESNAVNWRTVSYASPYFGTTQPQASANNTFETPIRHMVCGWYHLMWVTKCCVHLSTVTPIADIGLHVLAPH
jgi:hypothetical protein